jgi:hypothetical protein
MKVAAAQRLGFDHAKTTPWSLLEDDTVESVGQRFGIIDRGATPASADVDTHG